MEGFFFLFGGLPNDEVFWEIAPSIAKSSEREIVVAYHLEVRKTKKTTRVLLMRKSYVV